MYLYGASGHAKVIIDILQSADVKVAGLFDDKSTASQLCGIEILGQYKGEELDQPIIISIGDNKIRKAVTERVKAFFGKAIYAGAVVSPSAVIGEGTVVMQGAVIQSSVQIGKHVIINTCASVDHDCKIGNFVHISPQSSLCGNVEVGEGTHIGAGATVIPNIKIGKWAVIGAGAVVIRDVPDFSKVVGVPGKSIAE